MQYRILLIFCGLGLVACQSDRVPEPDAETEHSGVKSVQATAATSPTLADSANDPAIWVNAADPSASLILGGDATGGLELYDLDGERVGAMTERPIGLVDLRYKFSLAGNDVTLIVAYDIAAAELVAFTLDAAERTLTEVTARPLQAESEVEGLCMYKSPLSGKYYVFAAGEGFIQQWELSDDDGKVAGRRIRNVPVGLGAGHCAVHDSESALYFAQETLGVFRLNAEPESEAEKEIVDVAQPFGRFSGDVKGVAIYEQQGGGFLLVSDADVSRLQVYDLTTAEHAGSIAIEGVDESEGIAATGAALSAGLESGLIVVSDDANEPEHTNFKIVAWQGIADALGLEIGQAPQGDAMPKAIVVKPSVETEPVASFGDAADDPAIWVHPGDPELSIIIGSQKQRGINVYDLDGNLLQSRADGRINNVDLRYHFPLAGKSVAVVAGSNRTTDSISLWAVDEQSRTLVDVADGIIDTRMIDPYGLCMYRNASSGNYYVFVNDTDGLVRQWQLEGNEHGRVAATEVREFKFDSQTEGCVADDETGDLYVGEEDVGIWKLSAEPDGEDTRTFVDGVEGNGNLTADVEGLAIYYGPNGSGYLVASNQGADNYALYERSGDNRFIGIFHVVADEALGMDGISETDGLDVTSASLGPDYPGGLFVAQDGRNITPSENQNFKLVPWQRISDAMGLEKTAAE